MGLSLPSVTQDLNSTFGLDLLFLEGGFLRKSVSDFSLLSHGQRLRAAQVGEGLEGVTTPTQRCHCCPCAPLILLVCSACPVSQTGKFPNRQNETRHSCSGEGRPQKTKDATQGAEGWLGCLIPVTPSPVPCSKGSLLLSPRSPLKHKGWSR